MEIKIFKMIHIMVMEIKVGIHIAFVVITTTLAPAISMVFFRVAHALREMDTWSVRSSSRVNFARAIESVFFPLF